MAQRYTIIFLMRRLWIFTTLIGLVGNEKPGIMRLVFIFELSPRNALMDYSMMLILLPSMCSLNFQGLSLGLVTRIK